MKKIIFLLMMLCSFNMASAQATLNGTAFTSSRTSTVKDTVVTKYTYDGRPIVLNKKTGSVYCMVTSKNNKVYRKYINDETVKKTVCKEYGVEYKPKKK